MASDRAGVASGQRGERQEGAQVVAQEVPTVPDGLALFPVGLPDHREHLAGAHLPVAADRLAGVPLELVEDVLHPDVVDPEIGQLEARGSVGRYWWMLPSKSRRLRSV